MIQPTLSETRASYNRISSWYDFISGKREKNLFREGIMRLTSLDDELILEVGCGTGSGLISLACLLPNSNKILGIDISEGMLDKAYKKISDLKLQNIYLDQADARFLPFKDNSFAGVIFGFTLELFFDKDIPRVINECIRILKPEGKIVIVCLALENTIPVKIYSSVHMLFPKIVDCRPINLSSHIDENDYRSIHFSRKLLWGLPVDIVDLTIN